MGKKALPPCQVAVLGREFGRLWKEEGEIDSLDFRRPDVEKQLCEIRKNACSDQRNFVETQISVMKADSLEGALAQTIIVHMMVDLLLDCTKQEEPDPFEIANLKQRIDACHYSILRVIENAAGVSGEAFGSDGCMSEDFDPHKIGRDRLAETKRFLKAERRRQRHRQKTAAAELSGAVRKLVAVGS